MRRIYRKVGMFFLLLILEWIVSPYVVFADETVGGVIGFDTLLLQSMNPFAVLLSVAFTQGIKFLLPGPTPGDRSTETVAGTIYNRILPFVPILFGCIAVALLQWGQPIRQSLAQGIVSGIAAAYFYRTWKVTIFGE